MGESRYNKGVANTPRPCCYPENLSPARVERDSFKEADGKLRNHSIIIKKKKAMSYNFKRDSEEWMPVWLMVD